MERRYLGASWEAESPAGQPWEAPEGSGLPWRRSGGLTLSLPLRLWKVWVQVPSPEPFFQHLYVSHSGDFKVRAAYQ